MSETTRIITLRVTHIGERFKSKEEHAEVLKQVLELGLSADNVIIDNVQDFIIEKGENNDQT